MFYRKLGSPNYIIIITIIKWIPGTKCFVTVRFDIAGFFISEPEFFEYACLNRLE